MRVAIVGSRNYPNLEEVREFVRSLSLDDVVVTGGANGVDKVAEDEARKRGLEVVIHRAKWAEYGKKAGPIRNSVIVEDCDKLAAFWDKKSPGTKDVIGKARRAAKLLKLACPGDPVQLDLF